MKKVKNSYNTVSSFRGLYAIMFIIAFVVNFIMVVKGTLSFTILISETVSFIVVMVLLGALKNALLRIEALTVCVKKEDPVTDKQILEAEKRLTGEAPEGTKVKFCSKCGLAVYPDDEYCFGCGAKIKRKSDTVPTQQGNPTDTANK